MKMIEGELSAKGSKVCIVASRFNSFISDRLMGGAIDALTRSGVSEDDITVVKVPGAFEIPLITKRAADSGKFDGILCLGAIIRGATPHFEYVAAEATKGIAKVMLDTGIPVSFGIITSDTIEQAIERAGTKMGNKGESATLALIEMMNVVKKI